MLKVNISPLYGRDKLKSAGFVSMTEGIPGQAGMFKMEQACKSHNSWVDGQVLK